MQQPAGEHTSNLPVTSQPGVPPELSWPQLVGHRHRTINANATPIAAVHCRAIFWPEQLRGVVRGLKRDGLHGGPLDYPDSPWSLKPNRDSIERETRVGQEAAKGGWSVQSTSGPAFGQDGLSPGAGSIARLGQISHPNWQPWGRTVPLACSGEVREGRDQSFIPVSSSLSA